MKKKTKIPIEEAGGYGKMNKKKVLILAGGICLVVAVIVVAAVIVGNSKNEMQTVDYLSEGNTITDGEDPESEESQSDDMPTVEESENVTDETVSGSGESKGESIENSGDTGMPFPSAVEGTTLTIQNINSYDGIFLEDGSDTEAEGITAMLVENTGDTNIEYAEITVKCDDQQLEFVLSDLPAGASAIVQEKNKAPYSGGIYTDCRGTAAQLDEFEMSEDKVQVEEMGNGSLQVTNLTDKEIPCVRIFYKFYMAEEDAYVGGITYVAKLTSLEAGSSQSVSPSHYSAGNSRIMMVRTYDTAE